MSSKIKSAFTFEKNGDYFEATLFEDNALLIGVSYGSGILSEALMPSGEDTIEFLNWASNALKEIESPE